LKWHPDRWASKTEQEKTAANETFQKINRAFEVLSDPVKRRRYDEDIFDKAGSLNMEKSMSAKFPSKVLLFCDCIDCFSFSCSKSLPCFLSLYTFLSLNAFSSPPPPFLSLYFSCRYDAGVEDSDLDDEHGGGGGRGNHGGMSPEMMNMFMRQHMGGGGFSF